MNADIVDSLAVLAGVVVTQVAGVVVMWVKVAGARRAAEKAEEQTRNTGNGFALRVETALTEIKEGITANRDAIASMRTEAASDRQVVVRHLEHHLGGRDG